jgi:F0F1-type ATP synthase epsilon subunit
LLSPLKKCDVSPADARKANEKAKKNIQKQSQKSRRTRNKAKQNKKMTPGKPTEIMGSAR